MKPDARKAGAALVLALGKPTSGYGGASDEDDNDDMDDEEMEGAALESSSRAVLDAIDSKDPKALGTAMRDLVRACKD